MLARYLLLVKRDFRDSHMNIFYYLSQIFTIGGTLLVYWYTSKAFSSSVNSELTLFKGSYFDFILIGELTFILPMIFYNGPLDVIRKLVAEGTLESLIMTGERVQKSFLIHMLSTIPSQLTFLLFYLVIAYFIFGFSVPLQFVFLAVLINLLALPLFYGLGMVASSIFLITGRGSGVISQLAAFLSILSGAYFPLSVLPTWLSYWGSKLSPFQLLMESTRATFNGELMLTNFALLSVPFIIWSLLLFPLGYYLTGLAFESIRKRGSIYPRTKSII